MMRMGDLPAPVTKCEGEWIRLGGLARLRDETVRVELHGILVDFGVVQEVPVCSLKLPAGVTPHGVEYSPDVRHDDRALGNEVPVVHVVLLKAVGCAEWGCRAPSDDLLERRGEVRESVADRERRQAVITDDCIKLGLALALHLGVSGHGEEERGHGRDGLQERDETCAQSADSS